MQRVHTDLTTTFHDQQWAVLERIASGAPLHEALNAVVALVESQGEGMLCTVLLVDAAAGCVRSGATNSVPAEYARAIDGAKIGPNAGSCGTAAFLKRRVFVDDIATHRYWANYKHLALPHGLRACWSTPIMSPHGDVIGTFAMYYNVARRPTPIEMTWVDAAIHLAAIAILRDRDEQAVRRKEARYKRLARLYAVSSRVNEAIVHVRQPQALYDFACQVAVEQGLARLAWIGLADASPLIEHNERRLAAVARFGADDGYVDQVVEGLLDPVLPDGPAATAMRTGEYSISNDIANDPGFHWKDAAAERGFGSCAVFPLRTSGHTIGVFALYAESPGAFGDEERGVLSALAADIAFGVESAEVAEERQRLVVDLRQSEDRLRAVIEHTPNVAIQWFDAQGRVLFANKASEKLFGWDLQAAIGRRLGEMNFPASEAEQFEAALADVLATGNPAGPLEFQYRRADGVDGVLLSTVFRIPYAGDSYCGVCMDVDLTEHRALEQQLHQAQRIQALGTLAGGIAHDFNNILSAVRGHTDLALMSGASPDDTRESLLEISRASHRAADLVRRILTFSRDDEPRREVVSLADIANEAGELLRVSAPAIVPIRVHVAPDTPEVLADGTQLHQIVMNLGTNAIHAMRNRAGTITVTIDAVDVDDSGARAMADIKPGRYARMKVTDQGTGMDAATVARAFEPFFTTKPKGEGTGLGLSVVHGIVKNHGGGVLIDSEPGRGTTFALYFPAHVERRVSKRVVSQSPERPKPGQHIMYVDDDEALVVLATRILRRQGYHVTGHSDSRTALADFRSQSEAFNAVVVDLRMPVLSGVDFAREVLSVSPSVRVVLVSGHVGPADNEVSRKLGVGDVVLKPQTAAEFAQILQSKVRVPAE